MIPSVDGKRSIKGIRSAELWFSRGGMNLTNKGKGNDQNTHGHSNCKASKSKIMFF
jgi:hypothetical protein|tara:strand:+ start:198 stop:365 length:168 start_codon:yes stop_codon:yes gene_type:complete